MKDKKPLVIIAGPTSVGKTGISIQLAKRIHGEIISADSMQVYKGMDIGTAKITSSEMEGVPHYLIDILRPKDEFNVVVFQKYAKHAMETIYRNGHIPILVGGTGFYIQSILYDIDFSEGEQDIEYRATLEAMAIKNGDGYLHRLLQKVDAKSADNIHPNNRKRVIRALEYYKINGEPISKHNEEERKKISPYEAYYFVLNDDRERLYQTIEQRIDQMMENGLLEEVRNLKKRGYSSDMVSMQGLGYKELLEYLNGDCTLEESIYKLKRDTRHFAKRQLTWFRREKNVIWISKADYQYEKQKIVDYMIDIMNKKETEIK